MFEYAEPGAHTALTDLTDLVGDLPSDPVAICAVAQGLVIQPGDAIAAGVPEARVPEKDIRPAAGMVAVLAALDPAPLHVPRAPAARVVGTCRHFATLACAFLRARGIPSRARCGFGTYFRAGYGLDHWIAEYHDGHRWVRVDVEHLGKGYVDRPEDLAPGEFLTGGEAWELCRQGLIDPRAYGVAGTESAWGPAEISGNAVRDLAALCKREMLPWDEWGRMTEAYEGRTGEEYDRLVDEVARACAEGEPGVLAELSAREELAVPRRLLGKGGPT
ncbi:transglutaminase domain-containing protein [Streptomyces roseirectus]|uniref:Transglutaminase domain-containing protein n=1 Tax=Streptomyces roseirectus TaxID=2768066 RepID=A0A7H0I7G4_9ACTN|nr:transglutaminase-like domain-containing protein [Streptomyces roseirectus]QNP68730.1 transglutaminase domain-containing protein [Streptomyces roseirectus]